MYFLPTLRIASSRPVQKPKPLRNKENVKPKKKIPPSKAPSKSMYDQSPEDSFNISIQNEKAMNKQLNQLEQLQDNEFSALERILSENSKLSLSQVEDAINSNSSGKFSNLFVLTRTPFL